jgi:hypothetical protein
MCFSIPLSDRQYYESLDSTFPQLLESYKAQYSKSKDEGDDETASKFAGWIQLIEQNWEKTGYIHFVIKNGLELSDDGDLPDDPQEFLPTLTRKQLTNIGYPEEYLLTPPRFSIGFSPSPKKSGRPKRKSIVERFTSFLNRSRSLNPPKDTARTQERGERVQAVRQGRRQVCYQPVSREHNMATNGVPTPKADRAKAELKRVEQEVVDKLIPSVEQARTDAEKGKLVSDFVHFQIGENQKLFEAEEECKNEIRKMRKALVDRVQGIAESEPLVVLGNK